MIESFIPIVVTPKRTKIGKEINFRARQYWAGSDNIFYFYNKDGNLYGVYGRVV